MTRAEREHLKVLVSELAKALQILLRIAARRRRDRSEVHHDVEKAVAAINGAARALKQLHLKRRSDVAVRELRRRKPRRVR